MKGIATVMENDKQMADSEKRAAEERRRLKTRNWALLAVLVAFVVLVYFVSIVRMGGAGA